MREKHQKTKSNSRVFVNICGPISEDVLSQLFPVKPKEQEFEPVIFQFKRLKSEIDWVISGDFGETDHPISV